MNYKTKIIIILSVIAFIWIILLLILPERKEEVSEAPEENEEEFVDPYPTSVLPGPEELLLVDEIYEELPKPLNDYVPEESIYEIDYSYDFSSFMVHLEAESWEEYERGVEESLEFFYQFELDPCEEPLSHGISWTVPDWTKIEIKGDPYKDFCNN